MYERENRSSGFPTRSATNWAVQPLTMAVQPDSFPTRSATNRAVPIRGGPGRKPMIEDG